MELTCYSIICAYFIGTGMPIWQVLGLLAFMIAVDLTFKSKKTEEKKHKLVSAPITKECQKYLQKRSDEMDLAKISQLETYKGYQPDDLKYMGVKINS